MIVSVTRLRLRSRRFFPGFARATLASLREMRRASGFEGGRVLADRRLAFWTVTRWSSAASMIAWRGAGAHGRAMPDLVEWCDEAAVVRWEQDAGAPFPSWGECYRRMVEDGRGSRVRYPSNAPELAAIPLPRDGRFARVLAFRGSGRRG